MREIELGLDRVRTVLDAMGLRRPPFAAITVAGTNGKGSTVAMLETCLREGGYRVGAYTSPHLVRYNERVQIDGREATDAELCAAFERVECARGSVPLTYFEFGTLAALEIFRAHNIEIAVLEVGMGGRLDAVNAIDPDVAIVTSIGIDHTAWLGPDREAIGREKAGIFRVARSAICGDPQPPTSLIESAERVGAKLLLINRDFSVSSSDIGWVWRCGNTARGGLPFPALRGDYQLRNAACALTALAALNDRFPLSQANIRAGLTRAVIPGRLQVLPGLPTRVFDVAHNPDAARAFADTLRCQFVKGATHAVFGMLKDKDIAGVVQAMKGVVDHWHVAALETPRSATGEEILGVFKSLGMQAKTYPDIRAAYAAVRQVAGPEDRVLVFGSFHTVGGILATLEQGGG